MNHFKTIETGTDYPDVLVHRDRYDEAEFVRILAFGIVDEVENMIAEENISFDKVETAISFIRDFTKTSAEAWCRQQKITYWNLNL